MLAMVGSLIFVGALVASCAVIAAMVAPQWKRIMALAAGRTEDNFAPLRELAIAERHIAVRRWATRPIAAEIKPLRAAA